LPRQLPQWKLPIHRPRQQTPHGPSTGEFTHPVWETTEDPGDGTVQAECDESLLGLFPVLDGGLVLVVDVSGDPGVVRLRGVDGVGGAD
jgi:hypothetical protein